MPAKISYFFISEDDTLTFLKPRIPQNFFTENGYEDANIPRVCLSKSLQGCLAAMSQNLEGKTFQVYSVDIQRVFQPTIQQVPDCKVTEEVWATVPVRLKPLYKIRITCPIDKPLYFHYGNNLAWTYNWNYEYV